MFHIHYNPPNNKQVGHALAERRILAALDHPFLLRLRFAFQTRDKLYLVTDYCQGGVREPRLFMGWRWFTQN